MIKLQHVEMLLAVEEAGTIRGAAERLGRTQPAVTKALQQAEASVGAALFERGPGGVVPTKTGITLLRRARIIKSELSRMREEVDALRGVGTGTLKVLLSPLSAIRIAPRAVRRFRKRYPDIQVSLAMGAPPSATQALREGQADILIGPTPRQLDDTGLNVRPLMLTTPVVVLAAKGSRHANATSVRDLLDADWLMLGSSERRTLFYRNFTALGLTPPEPRVNSDSLVSMLSMIETSDCVCTFPGLLLPDIEKRWDLVQVPVVEQFPAIDIAATTFGGRPLTPAGQHFLDCVDYVVSTLESPASKPSSEMT